MENEIRHNMKVFLLEKYGERTYRLNSWWCDRPLQELEEKYTNFVDDYYGAQSDWDFLEDIIIWRQHESVVLKKEEG